MPGMLKYRLPIGISMIAALIGLFYLDDLLDNVSIAGTWLGRLLGRDYPPHGSLMLLVLLVVIAFAAREVRDIFRIKGAQIDWLMLAISAACGCLMLFLIPQATEARDTIAVMATIMIGIFVLSLLKYSWAAKRTEGAVYVAASTMFAFLYLGVMPGFLIAIRRWHSPWVIAGIILVVKMCDTGAYFTGRAVGRHKLIPWLSPGKTWEGLIGGLAAAAGTAALLAWLSNTLEIANISLTQNGAREVQVVTFSILNAALAGALLGLVGQFGDLTASIFKRDAGIKDSGKSIPGFGGLLDVLDSPIVAAPVAYWLLALR